LKLLHTGKTAKSPSGATRKDAPSAGGREMVWLSIGGN
jgi:hypothetical protein